ncbi:cyclin-dependent kinase inhibitor 1B [Tiliqua scincoides]|uniref:cyclin-dependent kinase inhibitor 1B n=1 Tax=Tiliqua scincoides TaxID=71010 RepID=UPI0034624AD9
MSNVRLSNGSPTLERMEGRPAEPPKPSACRSLFGPVDHDALARELRRHRRQLEEAGRRRWNFDFQRHRPLQGRYEWLAVAPDALPAFYSRPPRIGPAAQQQRHPGGPGGSALGRAQGLPREEGGAAAVETEPAAQRKRPASGDCSPRNKRANTTEEAVSEDSPSVSSVEQTPKKSSPRRDQT